MLSRINILGRSNAILAERAGLEPASRLPDHRFSRAADYHYHTFPIDPSGVISSLQPLSADGALNHPDIRRRKRSCIAIRRPDVLPFCPARPTHIPFRIPRHGNNRVSVVEASGFEPERTEPKSVMLPLHHASINISINCLSMSFL